MFIQDKLPIQSNYSKPSNKVIQATNYSILKQFNYCSNNQVFILNPRQISPSNLQFIHLTLLSVEARSI